MNSKLRSKLAGIVARFPEVLALYLFGSRASGKAREDSDVDLALLLDPTVDTERAWHLRLELADLFSQSVQKDVDLVIMGEDLDLSFRVLQEGQKLFERDHDEACYREATIASMYYDFKPFMDSYLRKVAEGFRKVG